MTNIRATCPKCGEVDLAADDIDLRIASEGDGTYGFDCPSCVEHILKPADARIINLLLSGGVRPFHLEGPVREDDPPFTYDDLIDFHDALESEDAIGRFLDSID